MKRFKTNIIEVSGSGAYIQTYQRTGEPAMAEVVLFDGDRLGIKELENFRDAIDKAIEQLRAWNREQD